MDLLGLARLSGFPRLKLLAVRAFELGVTGPVQRNLRLWAGLSANPGLDGPRGRAPVSDTPEEREER